MPRVTIIVCCYNNKDIISTCLDAIKRQSFRNFSCVVVDDNSSDGTQDYIRKRYPWVNLIARKQNFGPSINRNFAIQKTKSDYVATLDSDVELRPNWLSEQVKLLDGNKDIGIASSKLLFASNRKKINSAGGGMFTIGIGFDRGTGQNTKSFTKPEDVAYACSAAMVVRRKMLDKIGLFDETYFYGNEDTDLGWRANLAGWRVAYNPKAVAYHAVNSTIKSLGKRIVFHGVKNRIRSVLKNYSFWNALWFGSILCAISAADAVVRVPRWPKIKALIWNIVLLPSTLKERRKVQATRKKKDSEIMRLFTPTTLRTLLRSAKRA
jgi:GT2 family glycosyltransferase